MGKLIIVKQTMFGVINIVIFFYIFFKRLEDFYFKVFILMVFKYECIYLEYNFDLSWNIFDIVMIKKIKK